MADIEGTRGGKYGGAETKRAAKRAEKGMSNFKMVGDKKYTLNAKGVYVDKDGYGSKALGFQIRQKVRKNAQGEYELVPKKRLKPSTTKKVTGATGKRINVKKKKGPAGR